MIRYFRVLLLHFTQRFQNHRVKVTLVTDIEVVNAMGKDQTVNAALKDWENRIRTISVPKESAACDTITSFYPNTGYIIIVSSFIFFVNPYSGNYNHLCCYHCFNPQTGKNNVRHNMEYSDLYVQRIRKLCKERGIAINKLATMSDVKQSTLDNIVRGLTKNPRVKTLHKVALAFNMTLADFLDFKELNEYSFEDDDEE